MNFCYHRQIFLCRTYLDLYTIMKEIGMEYQTIDAFPNDNIIYYGQHASKTKFPQCQTSRYQTEKVSLKVHHIPIIPHLQ
jgi:hypothetical protein